jgi:hypothetical protein
MTVHAISACDAAAIPFCKRCSARVDDLRSRREDGELWASLLYVHSAWSAAGL